MKAAGALHLLMSSDPRAVRDCMSFAGEGESVLLVDRAVDLLCALGVGAVSEKRSEGLLFALRADVVAAGLEQRASKLEVGLLSDEDWVDLVCASERVLSWK